MAVEEHERWGWGGVAKIEVEHLLAPFRTHARIHEQQAVEEAA